jgi:hypothetical protein
MGFSLKLSIKAYLRRLIWFKEIEQLTLGETTLRTAELLDFLDNNTWNQQ